GNFFDGKVIQLPLDQLRVNGHGSVMEYRRFPKFVLFEFLPGIIQIHRSNQEQKAEQVTVAGQFFIDIPDNVFNYRFSKHLEMGGAVGSLEPYKLNDGFPKRVSERFAQFPKKQGI